MVQATDHASMLRAQAKVQLLQDLCGGDLEGTMVSRFHNPTVIAQPYMDRDAYGDEEPTQ